MAAIFSTDINATKVLIGAQPNDIMVTVPAGATVAQVQAALTKISTYVGGLGTSKMKALEGMSGSS